MQRVIARFPEIALEKFKGYRTNRRNIYALKKRYFTDFRARSSSHKSDRLNPSRGRIIIDSLVELVDIFPTIADLAKIPIPICLNRETKNGTQIEQDSPQIETICSEGTTLMPLVRAALKGEVTVVENQRSIIFHTNLCASHI